MVWLVVWWVYQYTKLHGWALVSSCWLRPWRAPCVGPSAAKEARGVDQDGRLDGGA
eukprot:COSAG02_NODE_66727_length_254_cov_1.458065_1_plen_55_part_01